jgi:hypothetical protein
MKIYSSALIGPLLPAVRYYDVVETLRVRILHSEAPHRSLIVGFCGRGALRGFDFGELAEGLAGQCVCVCSVTRLRHDWPPTWPNPP